MICPECGSHNIYVKDSRHRNGFIYRRRVCNNCGKEFKTHERIIDEDCQNCKYNIELIMWDTDNERNTMLPNYDNPMDCCVLFAKDGRVYGYSKGHHGQCEMWAERKEE